MACSHTIHKVLQSVLVVVLIGLSGCYPGGGAPAARSVGADVVAVAVPAGPVAEALEAAAQVYMEKSGEQVAITALPADLYLKQAGGLLLAGSQQYDLLLLPGESLPRWVEYHALRPLETPGDAENMRAWLPALRVDGALYGLPTQPDPLALWYSTGLWGELGQAALPTDWEGWRAGAQALQQPPERWGFAAAGAETDAGLDLAAILPGFGAAALRADDSGALAVTLDEAPALRAAEFYAGLYGWGGEVAISDPRAANWTRGQAVSALGQGKALLGVASLQSGQSLFDCSGDGPTCAAGQPQLAPTALPGAEQCALLADLSAWVIPLHSPNPAGAERFAAWLVSAEGAGAWAAGGGLPAHAAVLENLALPDTQTHAPGEEPSAVTLAMRRYAAGLSGARSGCAALVFPQSNAPDLLWDALNSVGHTYAAASTPADGSETALSEGAREMRAALRLGVRIQEE